MFTDPKNWLDELDFFAKNNTSKLKIVHLNINSIFCKGPDWANVLRKNIFDIGFVQESKLGPLTPDSFVSDINYNLIRRDRVAGGGGLLVFVKKGYILSDIYIDEKFETIKFSITFSSKNIKKHTFITSYNPHFKMSNDYLAYLEDYLKSLGRKSKSVTLIGDLNMDLLSNNSTKLSILLENFNFKSFQNKPTHIMKSSQTCIDVVFSNNSELISSTHVTNCPFSDHEFVLVALNLKPVKNSPVVAETRTLNQVKLDQIDAELENCPFNLVDSSNDVNDKFFYFKKLIMDVLDTVAPLKSIRLKRNDLPWVDQDMRELFVKRDKLHTLASGFKDKNHTIWNTYRELRNFCKSTLRRKMKSFFEEKSTKDFKSSKDFWKFYNKFVVKSKKSKDDQLISNIFDANKNKMVSGASRCSKCL